MSKNRISYEEKVTSVMKYLKGEISQPQGAKASGVSVAAFQTWIRKYKAEGEEGLKRTKENKV